MKLGLLVRRQAWALSLRGKIVAALLAAALVGVVRFEAYPFLAVSNPKDGGLMILEAWLPTYMLPDAAAEFRRGHYSKVLVVRAIYNEDVDVLLRDSSGRIYGEYSSRMLVKYGVPAGAVVIDST